ncbi:MAG: DUF4157 domain-containing protein [Chloroflexi bacterium]|nr:DUF4157 domain-containing protein [Chloroflexota bacterium]MCL5275328.1 DUF4157 domain-containing protein [Chloroflexota bacterium]
MADKTIQKSGQKQATASRLHAAASQNEREVDAHPIPAPDNNAVLDIARCLSARPREATQHDIDVLQRTIGMRRTMRLAAPVAPAKTVNARQSLQRLLANRGITIQPKLTVGAADDSYEQEAERVAAQVMRMPAAPRRVEDDSATAPISPATAGVHRMVQRALSGSRVQTRSATGSDSFNAGDGFEAELVSGGAGESLPAGTRAFMESRFGADFGKVRLHKGPAAAMLNRAINAQAFTHGQDIYLGEGRNDLNSGEGKRLLAHELTHTIQQGVITAGRGTVSRTFNHRSGGSIQREVTIEDVEDDEPVRQPGPPAEVTQPAVPLMLADAPWAEVEARSPLERKEISQSNDPRYQKHLESIRPKAPQVGKLDKDRIGSSNQMLKEQFQARDPRYQKHLESIKQKGPETVGTLPESRMQQLEGAIAQDKKNQSERALQKEREERERVELQAAKDEANQVAAQSKLKYDALEPTEQAELRKDDEYIQKQAAFKKETDGTLAFWRAKLALGQFVLNWATQRLNRKSLLLRLKAEIATTKVIGRSKAAFAPQATAVYNKFSAKILTAGHTGVKELMAQYRAALLALAAEHKKVDDFDKRVGAKYGKQEIRTLMALVDAAIADPAFDAAVDSAKLDEKIKNTNDAIDGLARKERERMQMAQTAENKLAEHSTAGQDPRGKVEETEAIKKIKAGFTKVQSDVKGRDTGITNTEADDLRISTDILSSFADRAKEKKAHDLKAKYEAAPFYLDPRTSKVVHADRHRIKNSSGFKNAVQLETDYKDEVDKQYKASKEIWCKYLGYTNGNGAARVTPTAGGHDGVVGHNSVFLAPYTAVLNAKDKAASDLTAVDKADTDLLDVLYPNAGTGGAHYSLEFADPKPHAYRGGPTIPGARYQADRNAGNATWTNAETYMEQQQQAEEARVLARIQAAVAGHMWDVHQLDPDRRK